MSRQKPKTTTEQFGELMRSIGVEVVLPPGAEDDQDGDPRSDPAAGLRDLTRRLIDGGFAEPKEFHGMAGEYGYGVHFENDVFAMHRFYWGDCVCEHDERREQWERAHRHSAECYQSRLADAERKAGIDRFERNESGEVVRVPGVGLSYAERCAAQDKIDKALCAEFGLPYPRGCAVHCTCGYQADFIAFLDANQHAPQCPVPWPNFWYKPLAIGFRWYKWIGRDMEPVDANDERPVALWGQIYTACVESIGG